jgi:PAS domain S-box-containing protein
MSEPLHLKQPSFRKGRKVAFTFSTKVEMAGMWKVAIIEDDRVDREIYKQCLQQSTAFEFDFAEAGSAAEGIELSRRWFPDCILLDFHLPDMNGLEVLGRLRGDQDRPPCAIVMLTACGGEELAVRAMKGGAMDYLPKGQVTAEVLVHTALNAIERFQMLQRIDEQQSAVARGARQYQNLLNAIPQMVWMTNAEGNVEYANGQWLDYTGQCVEQAGPAGWDELLHPEDRERTFSAWTEARQAGSVFEIEHRLKRASDGSFRWHLVRAIPFRDESGKVTNWFGSCTEIENQKRAEAVNLQNEKLQSVGQLAAGIAHEFNNLLMVILGGASQTLESLPPRHQSRDILQDVIRACERAAELTHKMLAYAGKANLYMEPTDLNKLVRDTCDSLRTSVPQAIQLNISVGRDLPPVATDSRQMRQVIVDLLMNALEAIHETGAGTISVRTGRTEVGEGDMPALRAGKYVELEVLDTGCGMSEETRKKIFDPFFTTKFTGRGLGLAAVQGFVRSSGGGVDVDSAPGRGTRFRILLPAIR